MAVSQLPIAKWYYEETSQWTLDYPPFFAYFEFILGKILFRIDPGLLRLTDEEIADDSVVFYQRVTVILSEIVYFYGVYKVSKALGKTLENGLVNTITILILCNPGILLVDHIHFQYNAMLYGIQLLSVAAMMDGNMLLGGIYFAVVLNFKHIYLYQALAYFVYLLKTYCVVKGRFNILR